MAQQYQPGQRWISDSEAELGLGTVLAQDGRLLTVLYPATGDTRQYALRNAPLTRVRFSPGDSITHFEGWKMTVQEVDDVDGLLVYHGLNGQNEQVTLPETQLSNFIQFRLASDRLFAGQIDPLAWFSLRYHTLEHTSRQLQSSLWGLGGVRAQPIAHQLHISREVADRIAPRVLLADEVGLGKTIEAGLVIHRQLLSGRASRVLILVPENLQHQWLVEMRRRFNLQVALFDEERFIESDATNPFEDTQLALVALEWLVDDEKAQDALFAAGWDLLVVDEAHHLVWHEDKASPEYSLVEQLAEVIPGVLLLTATPEQLGQDSHFARLRLLDPNRFHDLHAFRAESENYRPVAEAVQELLDKAACRRPRTRPSRVSSATKAKRCSPPSTMATPKPVRAWCVSCLTATAPAACCSVTPGLPCKVFRSANCTPTRCRTRTNTSSCRWANTPSCTRKSASSRSRTWMKKTAGGASTHAWNG